VHGLTRRARGGQVRFLQGQAERLKEKLAAAERSGAASLAQKVRPRRRGPCAAPAPPPRPAPARPPGAAPLSAPPARRSACTRSWTR